MKLNPISTRLPISNTDLALRKPHPPTAEAIEEASSHKRIKIDLDDNTSSSLYENPQPGSSSWQQQPSNLSHAAAAMAYMDNGGPLEKVRKNIIQGGFFNWSARFSVPK